MKNSKAVGDITEAYILATLLKLSYSVSLPFGDNQRYDMIVDDGKNLIKAQCKTGRYTNGCVIYHSCSIDVRTGKRTLYTDDIDCFLVYCMELEKVYWIPISISTGSTGRLRIDATKNNQTANIRWAKDYEL